MTRAWVVKQLRAGWRGAVVGAAIGAVAALMTLPTNNTPPERVPSVSAVCDPDPFMAAENVSMIQDRIDYARDRGLWVTFEAGYCPLAATINIDGDDARPVWIRSGSFEYVGPEERASIVNVK